LPEIAFDTVAGEIPNSLAIWRIVGFVMAAVYPVSKHISTSFQQNETFNKKFNKNQ
jgi:hypothetical protein